MTDGHRNYSDEGAVQPQILFFFFVLSKYHFLMFIFHRISHDIALGLVEFCSVFVILFPVYIASVRSRERKSTNTITMMMKYEMCLGFVYK